MTASDKSRVKLLDRISHMYARTGRINLILACSLVAVLIIDALIIFIAAEDNEIYIMPLFHTFMSTMMTSFMPYIATSYVGDVTSFYKSKGMEMAVNGSMTTGEFFCTLPFRAKDIMSIRVMNSQKQIIVMAAAMIAVEIASVIVSGMGYDMYGGINGLAFLNTILWEVIIMLIAFSRNALIAVALATLGGIATLGSFMWIADYADSEVNEPKLLDAISCLEPFSGAVGIIICVAATALIIFVSDRVLKNKSSVSWNLSK